MSSNFGFGAASSSEVAQKIEASTPWMAASDGKLEILKESLNTLRLLPSVADENGYTLVHAAAAYNQISILEWLLEQNLTANVQDNDGDAPLHHVEHIDAARFLVERMNANPKLCNANNKTALQEKLAEIKEQMDDDDAEDDVDDIKELIAYLKTLDK